MTRNLVTSRQEVIERLVAGAEAKGANAVLVTRFDTSEMGGNWTEICAYGTAVTIQKPDRNPARLETAGFGHDLAWRGKTQPAIFVAMTVFASRPPSQASVVTWAPLFLALVIFGLEIAANDQQWWHQALPLPT